MGPQRLSLIKTIFSKKWTPGRVMFSIFILERILKEDRAKIKDTEPKGAITQYKKLLASLRRFAVKHNIA